ATTSEMARNVSEAASGTDEIAASVGAVSASARDTAEGVAQAQRAADDLTRMSAELQSRVARFTV
ncbi:methyl-accepting chemotaxis protein, partial [Motilibacter sp. E257]